MFFTGYYELRSQADQDDAYYYDSAGAGGSFLTMDTTNNLGTLPIPTVTAGTCGGSGTSTVATSTATIQDVVFGQAIQIVILALFLVAMIFNSFKKPWR